MLLPTPLCDDAATFTDVAVWLVGPLSCMPLREAADLVRSHEGRVAESLAEADLVVVGDGVYETRLEALRQVAPDRSPRVLTEPLFLQRLLDADGGVGVRSLQSPTMLAELVGVPVAAVRRWWRRGYLRATRELGRLPLFDLSEAQVARRLAGLLKGECSLTQIDALVSELESQTPGVDRPLVSLALEVRDGRLLVRDRRQLSEPSGQLVLDFETAEEAPTPAAIPFPTASHDTPASPDAVRAEAWDLADRGEHAAAIEACRVVLLSGEATAADHFLLAHLLYENGDLTAARERYYIAVECDDTFVEARINLGCVLGELGESRLAVAVLQGAVDIAPDLADARFHLAGALDQVDRHEEAEGHWRRFLELSPTGPWSEDAQARVSSIE